MLNLLKSDIYKLTKAKYFWVCLIISIVLAAGSIFLLDFTYKMAGEQMVAQMEQAQAYMEESGIHMSREEIPKSREELNASSQMVSFFAGNTTLILAVLVSLFVGSEFNNGTVKNMASKNFTRSKIYVSKLITCVITGILLTLIYAAVSTVAASVLWGFGKTGSGFWIRFFESSCIELLLLSAFISVFVMFSMLIRQNGGSLAANICFLEFISLVVMLSEMIIKKVFDKTPVLSDYMIDTNMQAVSAGLTRSIALRSLCVAVGFFAVASVIGILDFSKRDIR